MVGFDDIEKSTIDLPIHTPGRFSCKVLLRFIGPGFLVSMAFLDPGNLAGDLNAAKYGGYDLLWILLLATCCGLIL